ncbi:hypothetical protein AJ78_08297 [Emergomyces pasteurianus Ep9510]|uniref:Uncharacterized protein n=1 Tax=Emergomyces pasteurianus Ep9510 TaxID=1447872 RepID=A0A1J9Q6J4_9EURO|nr:hypothetical protein AJ78_08297 [Emergomyces pasteurianus Ep9510]
MPDIKLRRDGAGGVVGQWNVSTELPISTGDHLKLSWKLQTLSVFHFRMSTFWNSTGFCSVLSQWLVVRNPETKPVKQMNEDDDEYGAWAAQDSDVSVLSLPQK